VAIQFNMVAFMNKEGMPARKFLPWVALEQFNLRLLIPDFPDFHFMYSYNLFQKILYDVNKKMIHDDWITTKLYALAFDLYTSTNNRSQLAAHVRFLTPAGQIREILLSVVQIETEGEKGDAILDNIIMMLHNHGIPLDWMVGITADGANVNVGSEKGVFALIGEHIEYVRAQTCAAHSFVLFSLFHLVCFL
jgi:hypothetical protein